MSKTLPEDQIIDTTSRFFRRCLDIFGMATMKEACRRSQSQIYHYAEDTAHKGSRYQNPVDLILDLFERLRQAGRRDVAVGLVRVLADVIACDVVERGSVVPDKNSVAEECLDDLAPLADLHEAIRRGRSVATVKALAGVVKQEVDEDVAAYEQETKQNEAG